MTTLARKQVDNFRKNLQVLCTGYGAVSELARHIGIHRVTMSRVVNGHESVELEQAEAIAKFYGIALSDMLVAPTDFKKILPVAG